MDSLRKTLQEILPNASRKAVEDAFLDLKPNLLQGYWLEEGNIYRDDTIAQLKQDLKCNCVNAVYLSRYIASSVLLHCADGWSFLGRALDGVGRGDSDTARHLGYYAELRAAMSLLASEGIGIFSNQHFIVEESGHCVELGSSKGRGISSHQMTWRALDYWGTLESARDTLSSIIFAGGKRLDVWHSDFPAGFDVRHIARKWLGVWGLDLKRLGDDREARNEVSYRPTRLNPRASLGVLDTSAFLREVWTLCDPSGPSRFESLDRHLVRESLELAYEGTTGSKAADEPVDFAEGIYAMLGSAETSDSLTGEWLDFFTRKVQRESPLVIREATGMVEVTDARHHLQVLSRAVLLLRIATGACLRLLQASDSSRTDLEFWWKLLGDERGLWRVGDEPERLADLWADIAIAIDGLRDWESKPDRADRSIASWRAARLNEISMLGECERVALWGTEP